MRRPTVTVKQWRLRVCAKGAISGREETSWCADPNGDDEARAFRDRHSDLYARECNFVPHEWEFHQRHLAVDTREVEVPVSWGSWVKARLGLASQPEPLGGGNN